ncbi:MAG: NAD-dependent epimerase/dehydratase family protein, partial [bacterium]|nr:NAD-dependent epimerase/dehydratase family protein [bacterium]
MIVFLTGGTGYVGSAVGQALKGAGHRVVGLARSDASAKKLAAAGIEPIAGSLRDTSELIQLAQAANGVVHAGMEWGEEMGQVDRAAVEAMMRGLAGTGKPFVYTSGTWLMGDTEEEEVGDDAPTNPVEVVKWRPDVERMVTHSARRNIRGVVIRPVMVYGRGGGEVANFLQSGRDKGMVRYVGSGENHWSFVHVDDLCKLYVLALDNGGAGSTYVASSGEHRPVKEVAEAAAKATGAVAQPWPIEEARAELGGVADGLAMNQQIVA